MKLSLLAPASVAALDSIHEVDVFYRETKSRQRPQRMTTFPSAASQGRLALQKKIAPSKGICYPRKFFLGFGFCV